MTRRPPPAPAITQMWLNGAAIDPAASYSVTVNSFLASGGDNFGAFATGTDKRDTGQVDLQAMVDYMADNDPVSPSTTPSARWASHSRPVRPRST